MPRTPLGRRIEQRLEELDRDQRWLARRVGRNASTVSRWLDGSRRMTVDELHDVALVLHRDPSWLLEGMVEADDDEGDQPVELGRVFTHA